MPNPPVRAERVLTESVVDAKLEALMNSPDWNKLIYLLRDMNASVPFSTELATSDADILINKNRSFSTWLLAAPGNDAQLVRWVMTEAVTFPALFSGGQVAIGVSATAQTTYSIEKNGTEVGTIVVETNDTFAFTSTASAAVAFAAGDVLTIEAQATADATLADVAITLIGAVA